MTKTKTEAKRKIEAVKRLEGRAKIAGWRETIEWLMGEDSPYLKDYEKWGDRATQRDVDFYTHAGWVLYNIMLDE